MTDDELPRRSYRADSARCRTDRTRLQADGGRADPVERTLREQRSLDRMRKTIAKRLSESYREAVHVTLSRQVNAEPLLEATEQAAMEIESISFVDLLLCALSETLAEHPEFNATYEDGTHRLYEEHNIGLAVDIDSGLVTPVLGDVASKSLETIHRQRRSLVDRVRAGEYSMSDFRNGTFTVTNLGPLGVDSFTPIINPPEIAILAVGRLDERAMPDGDGGVTFRRELPLDLSFDHRVVDGADGARFLETLAGNLEAASQFV
ncbi:2-oxo acid dehydrogenase subunit E2 [Halovenus sp. WSH3]|uniref:2-oxo acid dehydrogenase subunit E2 n=1 Tax=Halovenus carboxidivorans TaxID=2692199 RepID=A0A6B0T8Z5_9EURY|nr:2-oxo acid dehydrogenase subunit E2 [Halovenus carboxidivorans]MXR52043.1 2-oxo acid dehydrogenase subunit E2 [Halovenus carboxidivorans]